MKKTLATIAILFCLQINAQSIITIAGNGTGFSGDGGQATAAGIGVSQYAGVAVDAVGNIYISAGNNRIRKVQTIGIITTIAGTGVQGYSGDGGPATAAQIGLGGGTVNIQGVAVDAIGNFYIADFYNSRVRKVDTSGIITTVAGNGISNFNGDGGQATAAEISEPSGVAFDAANNLYVAGGGYVRKVNTLGIISTVAGNGTAPSSGDGGQATAAGLVPWGVTIDAVGNMYIADRTNNRVRKVNTSGIISTVAGYTNTTGYNGDGGQATLAKLYNPKGVVVDAVGNLYIADSDNYRVRKVDLSGIITTLIGNGTAGYTGDDGLATAAEIDPPSGIAIDTKGNFYISCSGSRIRFVCNSGVNMTVNSPTICTGSTAT